MARLVGVMLVAMFAGLVSGCAETKMVSADAIMFEASADWRVQQPTHPSRRLQLVLSPREAGSDDARLIVWNFPSMRDNGDGAMIHANMMRWCEQFLQSDGTPTQDAARFAEWRVNGMPVHLVDISGRYVAETAPGSGLRVDRQGYRMIGAYVVSPDGDYIVKLIGPAATVAQHEMDFDHFIRSAYAGGTPIQENVPSEGRSMLATDRTP